MSEELPTIKKKKPLQQEPTSRHVKPSDPPVEYLMLEIPCCSVDVGFAKAIHAVRLNGSQAKKLKQVALALNLQGKQLANGKFVENGQDAVRWILENLT